MNNPIFLGKMGGYGRHSIFQSVVWEIKYFAPETCIWQMFLVISCSKSVSAYIFVQTSTFYSQHMYKIFINLWKDITLQITMNLSSKISSQKWAWDLSVFFSKSWNRWKHHELKFAMFYNTFQYVFIIDIYRKWKDVEKYGIRINFCQSQNAKLVHTKVL